MKPGIKDLPAVKQFPGGKDALYNLLDNSKNDGDPFVMVKDADGPIAMPTSVLRAAEANGEVFTRFTEAEEAAFRRAPKDAQMEMRVALSFEQEKSYSGQTGIRMIEDPEIEYIEALQQRDRLTAQIDTLQHQAQNISGALIAQKLTNFKDHTGFTHDEFIESFGMGKVRGEEMLQDMIAQGHVSVYGSPGGPQYYQLSKIGSDFYSRYLSIGGGTIDNGTSLEEHEINGITLDSFDEEFREAVKQHFIDKFSSDITEGVALSMYEAWMRSLISSRGTAEYFARVVAEGGDPYAPEHTSCGIWSYTDDMVDKYLRWTTDDQAFVKDAWPSEEAMDEHHVTARYWLAVPTWMEVPPFDLAREIAMGRARDTRAGRGHWFVEVNTKGYGAAPRRVDPTIRIPEAVKPPRVSIGGRELKGAEAEAAINSVDWPAFAKEIL